MNISGKIALIKEKLSSGQVTEELHSLIDEVDEEVSVMLAEMNLLSLKGKKNDCRNK